MASKGELELEGLKKTMKTYNLLPLLSLGRRQP
jgi:hypothetical protein